MALQVPAYSPPTWSGIGPGSDFKALHTAIRDISQYLQNKQSADTQFFNLLSSTINGNSNGYGPDLASAATIQPNAFMHRVTGTATVTKIGVPPDWNGQLALISQDGFSFGTGGNIDITSLVTFPASVLIQLIYFPPTQLWYITSVTPLNGSITTAMLAPNAVTANGSIVSNASTPITTSDVALGTFTVAVNASTDIILISGSISSTASNYNATGSVTMTTKLWRNATIVGGNVTAGTLLNSWPGFINSSNTPVLAGEGSGSPNWNDTGVSGPNSYTFSMSAQSGPTVSVVQIVAIAIDFKR